MSIVEYRYEPQNEIAAPVVSAHDITRAYGAGDTSVYARSPDEWRCLDR
jgi:hypothetical protein